MGWKPGKLLKKAWKGIKKGFKSIGKGIKKAFGKIGKFFGKFGVLGQIGLMMLMGPLSQAMGGILSGALGKVGSWSAKLMAHGGWGAKGLGHALNVIHKAGTFVGKAYTTISDGIGNAIDRVGNWTKGNGFTLSPDRASIFNPQNKRSMFSAEGYSHGDHAFYGTKKATFKVGDEVKEYDKFSWKGERRGREYWQDRGDMSIEDYNEKVQQRQLEALETELQKEVKVDSGKEQVEVSMNDQFENDLDVRSSGTNNTGMSPEELEVSSSPETNLLDVDNVADKDRSFWDITKEEGILTALQETGSEAWQDFKDTTPSEVADYAQDKIDETVTGGVMVAGQQEIAKSLGYEVGDQYVNVFNMTERVLPPVQTVFSQVDLSAQQAGNPWYGTSFENSFALNEAVFPDNSWYAQSMNNLGAGFYSEGQYEALPFRV